MKVSISVKGAIALRWFGLVVLMSSAACSGGTLKSLYDDAGVPASSVPVGPTAPTAPATVTNVTSSHIDATYGQAANILIQVTFSKAVIVTGTPQLTLTTGAPATTAVNYTSGTGTNTLTFTYTVAAGNFSAKLDYASATALALNGGTILDASLTAADLTLPAPGSAGSLGANKNLVINTTLPSVTSVTSSTPNGSYKAGSAISIQVVFSSVVNVVGTPQLTLSTGTPATTVVNYVSGTGTNTLTFTYTIAAGNTNAILDYASQTALALNGGTILDAGLNPAILTLSIPGAAGSLGANKALTVDTTTPTVTGVTASNANGTYGIGSVVGVQVVFGEIVNVTGTPQLTLSTGAPATTAINYTSGSGTNTLTFNYTVVAGNTSANLDFASTTALALNGGTINDPATNAAVLTLASPGAANSIGANKALVIDGIAPTVTNVTSSTANATYGVGAAISVQVTFSKVVNVTGTPQLTLSTGTPATTAVNYASGTGTNTLTFTYNVIAGNNSIKLDYANTTALGLNGGTIKDVALNNATLTLAAPGAATSLGNNKNIVIDAIVPTVTNVTASNANGTYGAGTVVNVQVVFSKVVNVTGTPQLTLSTGTPATTAVNYSSGTGTNTLVFAYTVASGNTSANLDYASTGALALNGGTIADAVGNTATLTLAAPGAATSLGNNKAIVIDTLPASVTNVTSATVNGTYGTGAAISIQVVFSKIVNVTGTPQLTLNTGTPATTAVNYASGTGTNTLNFTYTVAAGNASANLDYASTGALGLNGGTIQDAGLNNATLTLVAPGAANSLGNNKALVINTSAPVVSNVTSVTANGTYTTGAVISIQVVFSTVVNVTGTPQLILTTGTPATTAINYASGTGTNTLTFTYTVAASNASADLDYANTTALALSGGTIKDGALNNAVLTLAAPAAAGSLGANKAIVIDTTPAPTVTNVTSATANGSYKAAAVISIQVVFSKVVNVLGTPTLTLSTGTPATTAVSYASGTGTNTLTFTYTVAAGNTSANLDYSATTALAAGTSIKDAASNNATLTLAAPGAATSLGANKAIVIDTTTPVISAVAPATNAFVNSTLVSYTFSEACATATITWTRTGGTVDAGSPHAQALAGTELNTGVHSNITITSNPVLVNGSIYSIAWNCTDAAGNVATAVTRTNVTYDTTAPTVTNVTSSTANGTYAATSAISIQVTFSKVVNVTGTPQLALSTGTPPATAVNYTSGTGTNTLTFTYTVAAGNTSVKLDYLNTTALTAGTSIKDAAGNNATLTLAAPGAATSLGANKTIVIDTAAPTIVSAQTMDTNNNGKIDHYKITFSKSVKDSTFPGYVSGIALGTATVQWLIAGYATIQFDPTVAGDVANDAVIYVKFAEGGAVDSGAKPDMTTTATPGVTDNATPGNALGQIFTATVTEADTALPIDASATAPNNTTVNLVFSEIVQATTAECASALACSSIYTLTGGLTVSSAVMSGGAGVNGTTVVLTTNTQTGGTVYTVTTAVTVKDLANNILNSAANTATFTGAYPLTILSSAVAINNTTVRLTFNTPVTAATSQVAGNYSIAGLTVSAASNPTSSATVNLTVSSMLSASAYTVTVTTGTVAAVTGGVTCITPNNTATFNGDILPTVLSAASVDQTHVDVTFSKAMQWDALAGGALVFGNYAITGGAGLTVSAAVAQTAQTVVRLTTTAQVAAQSYTVTVTGAKDANANAMGSPNFANFVGLENIKVVTAAKIGATTDKFTINFSKNVKTGGGVNAADNLANYNFPAGLGTVVLCTSVIDAVNCPTASGVIGNIVYFRSTPAPAAGIYTVVAATAAGAPPGAAGCILDTVGTSPGNCLQSNPNDRAGVNFGLPTNPGAGPVFTDPFNDGVTVSGQVFVYNGKIYIGPNKSYTGIFQVDINMANPVTITLDADNGTVGNQPFASPTLEDATSPNTLAGIDYFFAGCYSSSLSISSTLTGTGCSGAGGTEYLFTLGFITATGGGTGYNSNWNTTNIVSPFVFNHVNGFSNFAGLTWRSMSGLTFKGQVYQAGQHQSGSFAPRWDRFQPPAGAPFGDLGGRFLNRIGEGATIPNGQGPHATGLISIDSMYEYDNDGAGTNPSQLYIANGGSCSLNGGAAGCLTTPTRTAATFADGGVLRSNPTFSTIASPPVNCTSSPNCATMWDDITPTHTNWLYAMSIALPQDAIGDGVCSTIGGGTTEDWDCLVPANTITPAIKAVPTMVSFNGDLYMIRNACSTAAVQTLTTVVKNTCPAGSEVPQLWRLPAGTTATPKGAADWVPVAQRNSTGTIWRTDMTNATGGPFAGSANNTQITMLVANGSRLFIGFDNGTNGVNVWRTKAGVTAAATEADFEPICAVGSACNDPTKQFGFGSAATYSRMFSSNTVNDAGTDYLIFTSGNGTNVLRVFRAVNN